MDFDENIQNNSSDFRLNNSFWSILNSDPYLKNEFDALVEKKANVRFEELINSEAEKVKNEIIKNANEKGYKDGFDLGMKEGLKNAKDKISELKTIMETVVDSVKKAKFEILKEHESSWLKALNHVLKRLLIPKSEEILERVKLWIEEKIKTSHENMKLIIFLSEENYKKIASLIKEKPKDWELREDSSLVSDDIRIETEYGGIILSSQKEIAELDEILSNFISKKC